MSFRNLIRLIKRKRLKFLSCGSNLRIIGYPIYIMNKNVQVGNDVCFYPNITILGEGDVIIGNNVKIGNNVVINATKGSSVTIGDFTIIAANTYIIDCNHNIKKDKLIQEQGVAMSPVLIGKDVWIGASCVIGMGVTIHDGALIGANSFVNKNIPEYSIAVGSPAKVIRKRE